MNTPPQIDAHQLIVFYFVASEKSITSAAERLCLTQPTVTHHIKAIENYAGVRLFNIKKQRLYLTTAGQGLFQHAEEVYRQLHNADNFLEMAKKSSIKIGVSPLFSYEINRVISQIQKLYPKVSIAIKHATSFEIVQDVLNSELYFGIIVDIDYRVPSLNYITISEKEKLVFATSPSNPLLRKEKVDIVDLYNCPLILGPENSTTRRIVFNLFKAEGLKLPPPVLLEVDAMAYGKTLAKNQKCVGLWYIGQIKQELQEGQLKIVPFTSEIEIPVYIVMKCKDILLPIVKEFISLSKDGFKTKD